MWQTRLVSALEFGRFLRAREAILKGLQALSPGLRVAQQPLPWVNSTPKRTLKGFDQGGRERAD